MSSLYDRDFYAWTQETADALRAGRFAEIEREAAAEEIESLGRRDKHALRSQVRTILEHRLKLDLAKGMLLEYNRRGWEASILHARAEIRDNLEDSPSLCAALDQRMVNRQYVNAARMVRTVLELEPPEACPYRVEDVL